MPYSNPDPVSVLLGYPRRLPLVMGFVEISSDWFYEWDGLRHISSEILRRCSKSRLSLSCIPLETCTVQRSATSLSTQRLVDRLLRIQSTVMAALQDQSERSEARQQIELLFLTSNCRCIIVHKAVRHLFATESFDGLSQTYVLVAISGI